MDSVSRERMILDNDALALHLAKKYCRRIEQFNDVLQVARIGLINSVDRFDPKRGIKFSSFATPTIVGEILRHFRDNGWDCKIPRRIKDLYLRYQREGEALVNKLSREPSVKEIAEHLNATEEEIVEVLAISKAVSLDVPLNPETDFQDILGEEDRAFEEINLREEINQVLFSLEPDLGAIIRLRFFEGLATEEIAKVLKFSTSSILRREKVALAKMRRILELNEKRAAEEYAQS